MSKKHRTLAIRSAANANSDINITPLVDVVLVLLIIFMVVTPLLEKDILVKVPSTEKVETVTDVPPDQLLIRLLRTGELKLNGNPIDINELTEKLRAMMNGKKPEDKVVFVSPDEDANYGRLIMVLDRAKEAGAEALGMTTEPPPSEEPKLAFAHHAPRPAGPEAARGASALYPRERLARGGRAAVEAMPRTSRASPARPSRKRDGPRERTSIELPPVPSVATRLTASARARRALNASARRGACSSRQQGRGPCSTHQ